MISKSVISVSITVRLADLRRRYFWHVVECLHHIVDDDGNSIIEQWLSKHEKVKDIIDTDLLEDRQNLEEEQWWGLDTLRHKQNDRLFIDEVFKGIFLKENWYILIQISQNFLPEGPIDHEASAWYRTRDWVLPEPRMTQLSDAYLHHSPRLNWIVCDNRINTMATPNVTRVSAVMIWTIHGKLVLFFHPEWFPLYATPQCREMIEIVNIFLYFLSTSRVKTHTHTNM